MGESRTMSSDVKFRAWDKKNGKMFNYDHGDIMRTGKDEWEWSPFVLVFDGYPEPPNLDHLIRMQYIGINDRNGTEIYESDIVRGDFRVNVWENDRVMENVHREGLIGVVTRFLSDFVLDFPNLPQGEYMSMSDPWNNMNRWHIGCFKFEVIGNTYENNDLLEEKGSGS